MLDILLLFLLFLRFDFSRMAAAVVAFGSFSGMNVVINRNKNIEHLILISILLQYQAP